jgi:hypothetical protein
LAYENGQDCHHTKQMSFYFKRKKNKTKKIGKRNQRERGEKFFEMIYTGEKKKTRMQ